MATKPKLEEYASNVQAVAPFNEITVDISNMQLHDVIRLSDITLPKGVTATGDADMAIVTAIGTAAGAADAAH